MKDELEPMLEHVPNTGKQGNWAGKYRYCNTGTASAPVPVEMRRVAAVLFSKGTVDGRGTRLCAIFWHKGTAKQ